MTHSPRYSHMKTRSHQKPQPPLLIPRTASTTNTPNLFLCSLLKLAFLSFSLALSMSMPNATPTKMPPIVYTIAGSDSGGGAGIQADLHAIHSMGCHGCTAITCLTAQNSVGVTGVHAPPAAFLREQLDALLDDLPPKAVKVGMLGSTALAEEVGQFLKKLKSRNENVFVVVDPVMISTSGHRLIDPEAQQSMIECVFPFADVLTPNKYEAEALLDRKLQTPEQVEEGAKDILSMGVKSVLIKGGHSLAEETDTNDQEGDLTADVNATLGYAQDFFLSSEDAKDRLCDGSRGVWLRSHRYDTSNTHGTGCTLSSSIASAYAVGQQQRDLSSSSSEASGAGCAIGSIDACCLGKAYVTAGIAQSVQLGKGPGPVVHTRFPSSARHYPSIALSPTKTPPAFFPMKLTAKTEPSSSDEMKNAPSMGTVLPIVDTVEWVQRLAPIPGMTDVQLRIKDPTATTSEISTMVQEAQAACHAHGVRLWINDYWEAAIAAKCFGVHLGQEDLARCVDEGGLEQIQKAGLALGVSTHSYAELSVALGVRPSYVSLGPVFGTVSKKVSFGRQGLDMVEKWRELVGAEVPLVAIGGIGDAASARTVKEAGANCVAVIGAVTGAENVEEAFCQLANAMEG